MENKRKRKNKKPISTFLLKEEDDEIFKELMPVSIDTAEEEIPLEEIERKKKILYVVCPLCGMHRKIDKTGNYLIRKAKKEGTRVWDWEIKTGGYIKSERSKYYNPFKKVAFNYNFKEEPFISIRISLGKKGGFPEIKGIRLIDIPKLSDKVEYKKTFIRYVKEIERQCKELLKFLKSVFS